MAAPIKKVRLVRKLNDQIVTPTLYNGKAVHQGKYMTGTVNNEIVLNEQGKPEFLHNIGYVEYV